MSRYVSERSIDFDERSRVIVEFNTRASWITIAYVLAPTSSAQAPSFLRGRSQHQPHISHSTRHSAKYSALGVRPHLSAIHTVTTSIHCASITLRLIPNRTPPPPKWLLCTLSPAARSDRTSYVEPRAPPRKVRSELRCIFRQSPGFAAVCGSFAQRSSGRDYHLGDALELRDRL